MKTLSHKAKVDAIKNKPVMQVLSPDDYLCMYIGKLFNIIISFNNENQIIVIMIRYKKFS